MRNLSKYLPVVLLIVFGCGEDEAPVRQSDLQYFPLQKGFYQIYQVNEVKYELRTVKSELHYQLKTEVVDSFVNELGGYTYTIHRSTRTTTTDPWVFQQLWSVRKTTANVVVSQENIPYIKLVFPSNRNRTWDGNALNSLGTDEYTLDEMGESYELPGMELSGGYVQVLQEDTGDRFNIDLRKEIYVRSIGLVYKEIKKIEYCSIEEQCDLNNPPSDNGTVYVQTLIEYGQN